MTWTARLNKRVSIVLLGLLLPPPLAAQNEAEYVLGGDFESGTLDGWTVQSSGAGSWFAYSDSATPPDAAHTDPNLPIHVQQPPDGSLYAVTEMNMPRARIHYRDCVLDGPYTLHLSVF